LLINKAVPNGAYKNDALLGSYWFEDPFEDAPGDSTFVLLEDTGTSQKCCGYLPIYTSENVSELWGRPENVKRVVLEVYGAAYDPDVMSGIYTGEDVPIEFRIGYHIGDELNRPPSGNEQLPYVDLAMVLHFPSSNALHMGYRQFEIRDEYVTNCSMLELVKRISGISTEAPYGERALSFHTRADLTGLFPDPANSKQLKIGSAGLRFEYVEE
jgi:hypothetical protein